MEMRLVRLVITGLILSGFVFSLSGCAVGVWHRTEIRNLPDELESKLSIGDTRQKVRNLLGNPLLDAKNLGIEVYRKAGRDLDYVFFVPGPGEKVIVIVLVAYDENEIVKDIAMDAWLSPSDGRSIGNNILITAGEFSFVNIGRKEPRTLLGPSISWEEVERMEVPEGSCSLVLLMRRCPMEQVSLDADLIVDLKDVHDWCGHMVNRIECGHNLCGTFIQKIISSGIHHLKIFQESPIPDAKFETVFKCAPGETVYAELEGVIFIRNIWHGYYEGSISISHGTPEEVIEMGELRQILWHDGRWYE
jgi:hypothetical protein